MNWLNWISIVFSCCSECHYWHTCTIKMVGVRLTPLFKATHVFWVLYSECFFQIVLGVGHCRFPWRLNQEPTDGTWVLIGSAGELYSLHYHTTWDMGAHWVGLWVVTLHYHTTCTYTQLTLTLLNLRNRVKAQFPLLVFNFIKNHFKICIKT